MSVQELIFEWCKTSSGAFECKMSELYAWCFTCDEMYCRLEGCLCLLMVVQITSMFDYWTAGFADQ